MQYNALHLHYSLDGSGRVAGHILCNFDGSGRVWGLPNASRVGSGSKKWPASNSNFNTSYSTMVEFAHLFSWLNVHIDTIVE